MITEDNYIEWTLRGMVEYFRLRGMVVNTASFGQPTEAKLPVDRIVKIDRKIVGLQFKSPQGAGPPWKYKTNLRQHEKLTQSLWCYYCLPTFDDYSMQHVSLHHVKFAKATGGSIKESVGYLRWGTFADRIISCSVGVILASEQTISEVINEIKKNPVDVYVAYNRLAREITLMHRNLND